MLLATTAGSNLETKAEGSRLRTSAPMQLSSDAHSMKANRRLQTSGTSCRNKKEATSKNSKQTVFDGLDGKKKDARSSRTYAHAIPYLKRKKARIVHVKQKRHYSAGMRFKQSPNPAPLVGILVFQHNKI